MIEKERDLLHKDDEMYRKIRDDIGRKFAVDDSVNSLEDYEQQSNGNDTGSQL